MTPGAGHQEPSEINAENGSTFDRRKFLALGSAIAGTGILGAAIGPRAWDALFGGGAAEGAASAVLPGSRTSKRLVLVTLYGGNDGLNTVIPYQDTAYAAARGQLAIDPSTVLPLGAGLGLHPGLAGFQKLWGAKQLAIIQGVGFANPNYSHFESMDIWQSAMPTSPGASGWLGRWLDATGSDPLRAIAIGPVVPVALTGEKIQGAAIPAGRLSLPGSPTEQGLYAAMAQNPGPQTSLLAGATAANAALLRLEKSIGPIVNGTIGNDPLHLMQSKAAVPPSRSSSALAIANGGGGHSSAHVLSTQLSIVANLILAGASSEVYSVELGGFDTHSAQADTQTRLLGEVDMAVSAFVDVMGASERGKETVVLIYSEFGRRVSPNASAGTDHGWANVAFAAGPSVIGGFYGEPPDLSNLSQGNLAFTTDFRSVYATVLDKVLGADPSSFLGGHFTPLPFL